MQWHEHEATPPSETFLEAAWGLLEGSWVPLEGPWTALGKLLEASKRHVGPKTVITIIISRFFKKN